MKKLHRKLPGRREVRKDKSIPHSQTVNQFDEIFRYARRMNYVQLYELERRRARRGWPRIWPWCRVHLLTTNVHLIQQEWEVIPRGWVRRLLRHRSGWFHWSRSKVIFYADELPDGRLEVRAKGGWETGLYLGRVQPPKEMLVEHRLRRIR